MYNENIDTNETGDNDFTQSNEAIPNCDTIENVFLYSDKDVNENYLTTSCREENPVNEMSISPEFRNKSRCAINFNLLLTNARSLAPKMNSLIDYMRELDTAVAIVTESWLKPGRQLDEDIDDLTKAENLGLIHCSRRTNRGRNAGGGVALVYNKEKIDITEYKAKKANAELVCAIGKIPKLTRKIFIVGIYISPRVRSKQYHLMLEAVSDVILKVKTELENPLIILAGDFNHTNIEEATEDYPDMMTVSTGATRGSSTLDFISTNFGQEITDTEILAPLSTNEGKESDHAVISCTASLKQLHTYTTKIHKVRPRTVAGEKRFESLVLAQNWESFTNGSRSGSEMAAQLEKITSEWMEMSFPEKKLKIKSTDDPWITHEIRSRIRTRKKAFSRTKKRTPHWHALKKETEELIKKSKKEFYEDIKALATEKSNPALYYKAVNKLKDVERANDFDIHTMFPNKSDVTIGNEVAAFFNSVTDSYVPLENCPVKPNLPIVLDTHVVAAALKTFKKPKSMVKCDIFPDLATKFSDILAVPLTCIFNKCFATGTWPCIWKEETAVIIPKCRNPESMNNLRNLSCTPLYSKLMESFVLQRLKSEVKIRMNQFGGKKGSGTTHYLIDLWNEILEGLEDNESAVTLMSVDFVKHLTRSNTVRA